MTHTTPKGSARGSRRKVVAALLAATAIGAAMVLPAATVSAGSISDRLTPLAQTSGTDEVGRISADITRGGTDGSDLGVESDAANLVADAQLLAVRAARLGADVAFMNPDGLRSDLDFATSGSETEDGIVTFAEAFTFQPFNNTVFVLPMTGAQIQSVLEEQCQPGNSDVPVLHLGVSDGFTYDLAITTQGDTCTAIEVSNVQINGRALAATATYGVAVNNFLADGGANFDTFAEIDPATRMSGPQDIDALLDYFETAGTVAPPGTDRVDETFTVLTAPPTAVAPARLLETRSGDGFTTIDGAFEGIGRLGAGETVRLNVRGRGGVSQSAAAVNLQVGAIQPEGPGFLTVYPCSAARPVASSINFSGASVVSNAITSLVGDTGRVCVHTLVATDLYVDVTGYGSANGSPVAITPARYLDDRNVGNDGTFDDAFVGGGPLVGGGTVVLDVAGRGEIPADANAVILNVVAVQPTGPGFLTVFPCQSGTEAPPLASNVNYVMGRDVSNGVTTGVGGTGKVCIFSPTTTNLVVDVNGYVPADSAPDPVAPFRLVETRSGNEFRTIDGANQGQGELVAREVLEVQVTGRNDIPNNATSVYLNVTAVDASGSGYLTIFPCSDQVPNASNVNYEAGDTVANSVLVPLDEKGAVCVFSLTATDFVMDFAGYVPAVASARAAG